MGQHIEIKGKEMNRRELIQKKKTLCFKFLYKILLSHWKKAQNLWNKALFPLDLHKMSRYKAALL